MDLGIFIDLLNTEISEESSGLIVISGIFTGNICNGTNVYVAPAGSIHGRIKAKDIVIAGIVQGCIEVENLIIHSSGQLFYDELSYKELIIEEGGIAQQTTPGLNEDNQGKNKATTPYSDKQLHFNSSF